MRTMTFIYIVKDRKTKKILVNTKVSGLDKNGVLSEFEKMRPYECGEELYSTMYTIKFDGKRKIFFGGQSGTNVGLGLDATIRFFEHEAYKFGIK